jgi:hypothetical protein
VIRVSSSATAPQALIGYVFRPLTVIAVTAQHDGERAAGAAAPTVLLREPACWRLPRDALRVMTGAFLDFTARRLREMPISGQPCGCPPCLATSKVTACPKRLATLSCRCISAGVVDRSSTTRRPARLRRGSKSFRHKGGGKRALAPLWNMTNSHIPSKPVARLVTELLECGAFLSQLISGMHEFEASGVAPPNPVPIPVIAHELIASVVQELGLPYRELAIAASIVHRATEAMCENIFEVTPEFLEELGRVPGPEFFSQN